MKIVYRHFFGWFFILLGIIGLFLPILQGVLFLFLGAIILAPEVPFFHHVIERLHKKYPAIFARAKGILHRFSAGSKRQQESDTTVKNTTRYEEHHEGDN